ncbi:MAG: membrane-bound O-acyltransferase family protein [Flavobacteriales bacterium]|nr:MBOAT family protein [Bacteroidales bacterium AH-315-I05]PCJ82817.1 MAG: membrane-bound O-acyltransferase family protein [Flavobacteriales bacterium]
MLFNSIPFLLFAILFFAFWPFLKRKNNSRWLFLTSMSFIFYGWWDWRFLFLIIGSGLLDYVCGWYMTKAPQLKKLLLLLSLLGNIGSLSVFKYSVFYADMIESFLLLFNVTLSLKDNIPAFALILPVGISFYTFQSMSYTIDVYKGKIQPVKNIFHLFSYLAMFPQLVAGPIVRARDFLTQLSKIPDSTTIQKWHAIKLIVFGLFQKMVVADNIGFMVDSAFQNKSVFDGSFFWFCVVLGFAFQIYCDFSGYSLIARGIAKYMGYHFKMNFNHPYHATSIRDFWSRWHISLSTWFKDYVYIALGGSRKGFLWGIIFMFITMCVSGLWHGANYTFIIWGALHALFLALERVTRWPQKVEKIRYGKIIGMTLVFLQVLVAWTYFRADDIEQAHLIIKKILSFNMSFDFFNFYFNSIVFLLLGITIEFSIYQRKKHLKLQRLYTKNNIDVLMTSIALVMCLFLRGPEAAFIYFQF